MKVSLGIFGVEYILSLSQFSLISHSKIQNQIKIQIALNSLYFLSLHSSSIEEQEAWGRIKSLHDFYSIFGDKSLLRYGFFTLEFLFPRGPLKVEFQLHKFLGVSLEIVFF